MRFDTRWMRVLLFLIGLTCSVSAASAAISVGPPQQIALLDATIDEASGIVGSWALANRVWVHNDSGDTARFFSVSTAGVNAGAVTATFTLSGVTAIDWEDMAIGPKAGGGKYLYLADIGDNNAVRSNIAIYRVTEPTSDAASLSITSTGLQLQYPEGPQNAESFFVDPLSGDGFIITKALGAPRVYKFATSTFGAAGNQPLTLLGNLTAAQAIATAADISPDGLHILVRGYSTTAYLYERSLSQSVWDALQGTPIPVTIASETQGEAIGWKADGSGFYTTSERAGQGARPLYFYAFVPEPGSAMLAIAAGTSGLIMLLVGRGRNTRTRVRRYRTPRS